MHLHLHLQVPLISSLLSWLEAGGQFDQTIVSRSVR
jgi:hypothetical protein